MNQIFRWEREEFYISTDKSELDIEAIHHYLTRSTWAKGIDRQTVETSIANSLCLGLFHKDKQIGFARLTTDFATFGYLCDVYILEEYQKQGLARWLMECFMAHPVQPKLRRIMLATSTAAWLYEKFGFEPMNRPDFIYQITRPNIYQR